METETIKYGEKAIRKRVEGWVCEKCKRFWGESEHMASYCCATESQCDDCKKPCKRGWSKCKLCRDKAEAEHWFAKPAVKWNGQWPLMGMRGDQFFREQEDLEHYLEANSLTLDDIWLTSSRPDFGLTFDMHDYLSDSIYDDETFDTDQIDKAVNDWREKNGPFSYEGTCERLCIDSVRALLASQGTTQVNENGDQHA